MVVVVLSPALGVHMSEGEGNVLFTIDCCNSWHMLVIRRERSRFPNLALGTAHCFFPKLSRDGDPSNHPCYPKPSCKYVRNNSWCKSTPTGLD
ncbi:hypothetical protein BJX63DRAFT_106763 [Aspergillus granulosus]|uniref:Uncharacterized protein n=1 Tax=Aspergillus granulosus TaxID=176169 RepID=A0ABR4GU80_9EURO